MKLKPENLKSTTLSLPERITLSVGAISSIVLFAWKVVTHGI